MWIRRAFLRWLLPAAVVLPLWMLLGWGIFNAGAWAFAWVLFIAIPSVLVGELVLTLLVRIRPSVRASGAVSWWDVAGFSLWHLLTIALGCFVEAWWAPVFVLTIVVAIALFWLVIWQLVRDARRAVEDLTDRAGTPFVPPASARRPTADHGDHDVIVISENGMDRD